MFVELRDATSSTAIFLNVNLIEAIFEDQKGSSIYKGSLIYMQGHDPGKPDYIVAESPVQIMLMIKRGGGTLAPRYS